MPVVINISGGSGSGKTTLAERIASRLGPAVILNQDGYYRDRGHLAHHEIARHNFDHPEAVELELLVEHVKKLKAGVAIDEPIYDFATQSRKGTKRTEPAELIILEGLFVLHDGRLRELADFKIFVDEADDIRFIRRLLRDIKQRGCAVRSVVDLYLNFVKPMYIKYVLPSKKFADMVVSGSLTEKDGDWKKLSAAIAEKKKISSSPK
jgi:uridine kinase